MLRQAARRSLSRAGASRSAAFSTRVGFVSRSRTVGSGFYPTISKAEVRRLGARAVSTFKADVDAGFKERADQGIAPRSLDKKATAALVEELKAPQAGEEDFLMDQLMNRVPPGVDDAAYVKASFLAAVVKGEASSPLLTKVKAVELLGTMQGGYNVAPMIEAFYDVEAKAKAGNAAAKEVLESWAAAEWFTSKPDVKEKITVCVFKVTGETNT